MERAEAQVVAATNAFRDQQGGEPVRVDATLYATARRFAEFMARTGEYGHEADGLTPGQRLRREGYAYCMVAENIAFAYDSRGFRTSQLAEKMMDGWKVSPGHRRTLLDEQAAVIGVAIARSKTDYYYAVQLFARPMRGSRCQ